MPLNNALDALVVPALVIPALFRCACGDDGLDFIAQLHGGKRFGQIAVDTRIAAVAMSSLSLLPDIMTMALSLQWLACRNFCTRSMPEMPGSIQSIKKQSNDFSLACFQASSPSTASETS